MEATSATRVLLVEDEVTDALVVVRSLRCHEPSIQRFAVEHAATLAQGVEHLERGAVDVLLLDLRLPDSDGPETVARLRERDRNVPMVVFTGDDDPRIVARVFEAGADEYLVKCDLHGSLLRRTIRHAIERRRARSACEPYPVAPARTDRERGLLHDLKNLQTSILGNATILQQEIHGGAFVLQRLESLLGAARNAAELTRRIVHPEEGEEDVSPVELSTFVRAAEPLLRAVLPKHVDLRYDLAPELPAVAVLPDAMRRVLLELVVNAGEAIGDAGGFVEIGTGQTLLGADGIPEVVTRAGIETGPHVWFEVRDDGRGIDEETRARIFDRGFSTKGGHRGHGLGQVRSILAQHGAGLVVESRPCSGAAFRILLPVGV